MEPRTEMASFPNLEDLQIEDMEDLEYWSGFQAGDLPHLGKFSLRRCPKLKHLPRGLEHCKIIPTMELRDAGLVDEPEIKNIPVQELLVEKMPSLTTVSNLPLMKVFTVIGCPNLVSVSGVNSLQHIHMEDEHLDQLPKWLEQHASRIETLDIVGKAELISRCERNQADWYIISEIARVYAYQSGRRAFFSYTRSNIFFCRYHQRRQAKEHEGPIIPAAPAGGVEGRGASVSSRSTSPSAGIKSVPGPLRARQTTSMVGALVLSAAMLIGDMNASHTDQWQTISLSVLFFSALLALAWQASKTTPKT